MWTGVGELVGTVEAERPDSHKEEVAEPALVGKTLSHFGENLNDGSQPGCESYGTCLLQFSH